MGCVSSKILAKSGSFQEKVSSLGHSFQRSNAIEEIILSTSKSNGDQFLALLRRSTSSSARKAKDPEVVVAAAAAEPAAKIETIDVSELLAGLEEEESCTAAEEARERRQSSRDGSPAAPWRPSSGGGAAGKARSFRTVEEFDAMVLTQQQQTQSESGGSPSSERPAALATELEEEVAAAMAAPAMASNAEADQAGRPEASAGAKRRARARQLGELNVPAAAAFDFSKSGSLRDWLRQGGQIFSPGSYVTPRFGTAPTPPSAERGGAAGGEQQQQQAQFDPELVAQFERAMEQLSEDEGRVLDEILEALELEAAEKDATAAAVGGVGGVQPPPPALVQQV